MSYEQPTYEELAKAALAQMMCDLSQDCFCAGWIHNNEYRLWTALTTGHRAYGGAEIPERDANRMRYLHELAGGWWIWPEGEDSIRFVTTEEWLTIFAKNHAA
jgi:hypothetical protein